MFRNLKKNFLIFLLFSIGVYIVFVIFTNRNSTLSKKERLSKCLVSVGVDSRNIHFRNSGNYTELNWQWNTINGHVEPLVYLVAASVSDIQNAIMCCQLWNVRIVARSGGHSFIKTAFGDSQTLVVDLERLNEISLHPNELQCDIGAGARMGHIISTLSEKGHFLLPTGVCISVGIAGLALGGGYGHSSRLFGLTCDNVIGMEMVDTTGKLLVVNGSTNKDLFWALRGGGGGSYGIVTKFKLKMYAAPETVLFATYYFSFKDFVVFFHAWQNLITDLPNYISCILTIQRNVILMLLYALNYQNLKTTTASVESFDKRLNSFSFPVTFKNESQLLSYSDFILNDAQSYSSTVLTHPSQLANITKHVDVGWLKAKSFYVDKILKNETIFDLKELLDGYVQKGGVLIELVGGAINNISSSETAFVHRGKNMYLAQLYYHLHSDKPDDKADSAMRRFYDESEAIFDHRESYQNYLDQDISDYLVRYYGENLKRLMQIKSEIDPNNIFHHPQSIPLNFE